MSILHPQKYKDVKLWWKRGFHTAYDGLLVMAIVWLVSMTCVGILTFISWDAQLCQASLDIFMATFTTFSFLHRMAVVILLVCFFGGGIHKFNLGA